MKRRTFLQGLSVLPAVGSVAEAPRAAEVPFNHALTDDEAKIVSMSQLLVQNFRDYVKQKGWDLPVAEHLFIEQNARLFCQYLADWTLSDPLFEEHDRSLFVPSVLWVTTVPGVSRKLRVPWIGDEEADPEEVWAKEAALDVQHEIRKEAEEVGRLQGYLIYLPPFLPPSYLDPRDFSVHRRFLLNYTKVRA
jgi:hypothetical protein